MFYITSVIYLLENKYAVTNRKNFYFCMALYNELSLCYISMGSC